jgi:hypothetical protein
MQHTLNGRGMNAYKILVVKHKGKRQFRRSKGRWEDNIKLYIREIKCKNVDWI